MGLVVEVGAWAAVGTAVWLSTLSSVGALDVVLGVTTGLLCGLAAVAGRRAAGGRWRVPSGWPRSLPLLLAALAVDTPRVIVAAFTTLHGDRDRDRVPDRSRVRRVRLPDEPPEHAATRRALVTVTLSATPASVVLDADPRTRTVILHEVAPALAPLEEALVR